MSNKTYRINREQQLLSGLEKNLSKSGALVLRGEKHTAGEIISVLQSRIDAAERVKLAKAAWLNEVEQERTLLGQTDPLISDVRKYVSVVHGSSLEVLAEFGLTPAKPRVLTTDEMAAKVAKTKATREARHTMGKRQKARVHGASADTTVKSGVSAAATANGATNGK
jgi:hypothetical protein